MTFMKQSSHSQQFGGISTPTIVIILLAFGVLALSGFSAWSFMNYYEQKTNVDSKISKAVTLAEKEQKASDEKDFLEREKQPNREFVGPADLGSLSFMYPKTWSQYVGSEGSDGGDYTAFFNPVKVPPVEDDEQRVALRVYISDTESADALTEYQSLVEEGEVDSSSVKINGKSATRFDGKLSEQIRGSAVVFKIRDKTVVMQSDANTFKKDYNALLKTITFKA